MFLPPLRSGVFEISSRKSFELPDLWRTKERGETGGGGRETKCECLSP